MLHRDIKPSNLGVGSVDKTRQHLRLFDFSLALELSKESAATPARNQIRVGTVAYRDPFLSLRGAWDHAADRYSAAVTLHEMLTGVRPALEPEGAPPLDPELKRRLASERFDASARQRLIPFFERALHRSVESRFDDASEMREGVAFGLPGPVSRGRSANRLGATARTHACRRSQGCGDGPDG